jgi:hypothetical protein
LNKYSTDRQWTIIFVRLIIYTGETGNISTEICKRKMSISSILVDVIKRICLPQLNISSCDRHKNNNMT